MIIFLEDFSQIGFGGGQRFTLAILENINQDLAESKILHLGSNSLFRQRLELTESRINKVSFSCLSDHSSILGRIRFVILLLNHLRKFNNTTIVSCTRFTTVSLALSAYLLPRANCFRYICFHHLSPPSNYLVRYIYNTIFQDSRFVSIFPSDYLLRNYRDTFNICHEVFISPLPPISLPQRDLFHAPVFSSNRNSSSSQCPKHKFLYVGMIHPDKGIFKLINYLSLFSLNYNDSYTFSLEIYGSGPPRYIQKLNQVLTKLNFPARYYGSVEVTSNLYADAACLFVPSWDHVETLCFTALEGIKYCSYNIFAAYGVLPEYECCQNVSLSFDSFDSFANALSDVFNHHDQNSRSATIPNTLSFDHQTIDQFQSFWNSLFFH